MLPSRKKFIRRASANSRPPLLPNARENSQGQRFRDRLVGFFIKKAAKNANSGRVANPLITRLNSKKSNQIAKK